jgi:hypothetical protein
VISNLLVFIYAQLPNSTEELFLAIRVESFTIYTRTSFDLIGGPGQRKPHAGLGVLYQLVVPERLSCRDAAEADFGPSKRGSKWVILGTHTSSLSPASARMRKIAFANF